jgi:hypothetical protein
MSPTAAPQSSIKISTERLRFANESGQGELALLASVSLREYLPHDHARSRAYRWGEDGTASPNSATIISTCAPRRTCVRMSFQRCL